MAIGRLVAAVCFGLGFASAAHAQQCGTSESPRDFLALVSPQRAAFVFPVEEQAVWEWQLPTTPIGAPEYEWSVTGLTEGRKYSLGFSRYQFTRSVGIYSGTLDDLLRAGQSTFWLETEEGGMRADTAVDVAVERETGQIVVSLGDSLLIRRLFSSRPDSMSFWTSYPGTPRTEHTVPIRYLPPEPATPVLWYPGQDSAVTDFSLPLLFEREEGGQALRSLRAHRGTPVVLLFWDPRCDVCRREMEGLEKLARQANDGSVVFYAVVTGDPALGRQVVQENETSPVIYLRGTPELIDRYFGSGVPYLVILDREQRIAFRRFGSCPYAPPFVGVVGKELAKVIAH